MSFMSGTNVYTGHTIWLVEDGSAEWGPQDLIWTVLCTLQERRLKAERTGQMIDLTKDVSPAVLAQTAAKLEAEQKQRDEDEAQKELAEARKPFEARMVSCLRQE